MSLTKIEKYLDILLYFYSTDRATRNELAQKFEITYSTLSSLFRKWVDEGYLTRIEMDITYAGEDRFAYQITDKGIKLLKSLSKKLNDNLKSAK